MERYQVNEARKALANHGYTARFEYDGQFCAADNRKGETVLVQVHECGAWEAYNGKGVCAYGETPSLAIVHLRNLVLNNERVNGLY